MKIALINASPKPGHSGSGNLMACLKEDFPKDSCVKCFELHKKEIPAEALSELLSMDAWVVFTPLYVDALPSHLLNCLVQIENAKPTKKIRVYGVINCGFYEGVQTETGFDVLKNFCTRCGFSFCGGMGIGGGGLLSTVPYLEQKKHPKIVVLIKFKGFARKIAKAKEYPIVYTSTNIPRPMYKIGAEVTWRVTAMKNGNTPWSLNKKY